MNSIAFIQIQIARYESLYISMDITVMYRKGRCAEDCSLIELTVQW